MEEKVIKFEPNKETYINLSKKYLKSGDSVRGISLLHTAYKKTGDVEILPAIANAYSGLKLYLASNKYWFNYLTRVPKKEKADAFEKISVNYFHMGDLDTSQYYMLKRMETEKPEGLFDIPLEMATALSEEESENIRDKFYVAYPYDKANYAPVIAKAEEELGNGGILEAEKTFSTVPLECMNEKSIGEYAMTVFINGDKDKAVSLYKESLNRFGDNVTALTGLSNILSADKDGEKSKYYYEKALSLYNGKKEDAFKLFASALAQADDEKVGYFFNIVKKDIADETAWLYYGISLLNLGKYNEASEILRSLYLTFPDDVIYEFYARFSAKLVSDDDKETIKLPLKYVKEIPPKTASAYRARIRELIENIERFSPKSIADSDFFLLRWSIRCDDRYLPAAVYFYRQCDRKKCDDYIREILLDPRASHYIKKAIITSILASGKRTKIDVLVGNLFVTLKPKKIRADKDENYEEVSIAYERCLADSVFTNRKNLKVIPEIAEKIYDKYLDVLIREGVTAEELIIIIKVLCGEVSTKRLYECCKDFEIDYDKVVKILQIMVDMKV